MQAHQVVDSLTGAKGSYQLVIPNLGPDATSWFLNWMDKCAKDIAAAQHFVFENVPITSDGNGGLNLPGLDSDEQDMFSEGLIPVPFETCWFEAPAIGAQETMCYLIRELPNGISITPFRVIRDMGGLVQFTGEEWRVSRGIPGVSRPTIEASDPINARALFAQTGAKYGIDVSLNKQITGEVGLVLYLLLMLCSKTSEIVQTAAPDKLNRARGKKGKAPIPAHRTVYIVPRQIANDMRRERGQNPSDRTLRASPRLHWRRTHRRTLPDGRRIIIPRHLVGYKTLDGREMVTHDYRVIL